MIASLRLAPPLSFWQLAILPQNQSWQNITRWQFRLVLWSVFLCAVALFGGIILVGRQIKREHELSRLKTDFVSNVSHELKTPLTSIRMFVETLRLKRYRDESEASEYLDILQTAVDGEQGLQLAIEKSPDLIILDIMLPKMNGYEICRQLRRDGNDVPILMLTAKGEEMDKVMGLELGADDYVAKPFGVMELLARIKALLRRVQRTESELSKLQIGNVEIDFEAFTVSRAGEPIELTAREFALLRYLATNAGRALSRQMILNKVWGIDYYGTPRTVDNFITRLRQKIERNPERPEHILTIRGIGYKFVR